MFGVLGYKADYDILSVGFNIACANIYLLPLPFNPVISIQIGSEPTSPDISLVRTDPGNKRVSDLSLGTASSTPLSSSSSLSIPVYQTQLLSGTRSLDVSSMNNSSASSSVYHASPLSSAVLNSSDSRGCSTVLSSASTNQSKRRRSGPPTPLLNVTASNCAYGNFCEVPATSGTVAITTSTNATRIRHVSHMDSSQHHPRVTSSDERSDGLISPPFTSLTQLLLQDFPATTPTVPNGSGRTSTENSPLAATAPTSSYMSSEPYKGLAGSSDREIHPGSTSSPFITNPTQRESGLFTFQKECGKSTGSVTFITDPHPGRMWSTESSAVKCKLNIFSWFFWLIYFGYVLFLFKILSYGFIFC